MYGSFFLVIYQLLFGSIVLFHVQYGAAVQATGVLSLVWSQHILLLAQKLQIDICPMMISHNFY